MATFYLNYYLALNADKNSESWEKKGTRENEVERCQFKRWRMWGQKDPPAFGFSSLSFKARPEENGRYKYAFDFLTSLYNKVTRGEH